MGTVGQAAQPNEGTGPGIRQPPAKPSPQNRGVTPLAVVRSLTAERKPTRSPVGTHGPLTTSTATEPHGRHSLASRNATAATAVTDRSCGRQQLDPSGQISQPRRRPVEPLAGHGDVPATVVDLDATTVDTDPPPLTNGAESPYVQALA